jgi:hypothetical protein
MLFSNLYTNFVFSVWFTKTGQKKLMKPCVSNRMTFYNQIINQ